MIRAAITGMGFVSPLGNDVEEFRKNLFAGKSCITNIAGPDIPPDFPVAAAGFLAPGIPADLPAIVNHVTTSAVNSLPANFKFDAIVLGAMTGGEEILDEIRKTLSREGYTPPASENEILFNATCASGNVALGTAFHRIRAGEWKRALVGAFDLRIDPLTLLSFMAAGVLTTAKVPPSRASCPFTLRRSGFVKSQAAALFVLESQDAVRSRRGQELARIAGFGKTSDGCAISATRPDGLMASEAMRFAIQDAGLQPDDIDYISAHGNSTRVGDYVESQSIKTIFGLRAQKIPVSSLESQIGHASIACAAVKSVASILMLGEQRIAPTINYDQPDPKCDLDFVPNYSRKADIKYILSNSFGFGGQNACMVLEAPL